jgi:Tfp pilus assembly protein PilF
MKLGILLVLSSMLCACAMSPPVPPASMFQDSAFAAPSERIEAADIFALSPEMKQYFDTRIAPDARVRGPRFALMDTLYSDGQLKLEYDAEITRDAAQAFAARSGNCLSLVVMTAAFAKALGLDLRYQNVVIEETWGRDGQIYFSIGHVNVTLIERRLGANDGETTIDFLPPRDVRAQRSRQITEQRVVAMYMNNRAVEALVRGRVDDAYWWARGAIAQEPWFLSAYNTLGAVYERRGMPANAEKAFEVVLGREPGNLHVMSNLVSALNEQGRTAEASEWSQVMNRKDPNPPFSYFNRGMEAMKAHDYVRARDLFAKEVDRAPYYHEFHYWLAAAYVGLGEYAEARKHLKIAMENSTTHRDHDVYAAKYAWLTTRAAR